MRTRLSLLTVSILLALPATAIASLAAEQRQGRDLVAQLNARTKTCSDLSTEDFDHIGEYAMYQALGSTSRHQALNERMTAMMGAQGESTMHQLLGRRYTGCNSAASGGMMGPGMMGNYYGSGGLGVMMGSRNWSWMAGGAWQTMSRQDWRRLQHRLLAATPTTSNPGEWSTLAIVATVLGSAALVALAIIGVIRGRFRKPPAAAT
jgi:hypothetical protein